MHARQPIVDALNKTRRAYQQEFGQRRPGSNWADWYARYLLDETGFVQGTERQWLADDLALALTDLDNTYAKIQSKQSWADYLAERLYS